MQVGDKYFDKFRNVVGEIKEVRLKEKAVILTVMGEDYWTSFSTLNSDRYKSCQLTFDDLKG